MNIVYNCDCMEYMAGLEDNAFDLAIVDPPYGIPERLTRPGKHGSNFSGIIESSIAEWDKQPPPEYFKMLFKISKNHIIWGGNYFTLPPTKCPICWDKIRPNQKNLSEWEMAWTSFDQRSRMFKYCGNAGFVSKEQRIHPTQKPVALYKWLLKNYAKPGDKILDTHIGSGSIRIACHDMGFDLVGCELDLDYWEAQEARFKKHIQQSNLFGTDEMQELIYNKGGNQ